MCSLVPQSLHSVGVVLMKKVKSNYLSQLLGGLLVAVILVEVLSIAASLADFLIRDKYTTTKSSPSPFPVRSENAINHSIAANLSAHENAINDSIAAAKPSADNTLREKEAEKEMVYKKYLTDVQLLQDATNAPKPPEMGATPRLAFLFIVRGYIQHEQLWRRYFQGQEEKYSLYVHATPGHMYPNGSLFRGKEIPSKPCPRFTRGLIDALRRLLSYALLDRRYNNTWFINVCESSIPIRGFEFAYTYLMKSNVSFVESFFPDERYHWWETLPEFPISDLRKGELWMALKRDHARLVVNDSKIYFAFLAKCTWWCTWDEQYVQTLLHLLDGRWIAERTVMYVNWTIPLVGSPNALSGSLGVIKDLQSRVRDMDGARHDTAFDNSTNECVLNDVAPSPCFLFARKFASSETTALLSLKPQDLGY